MKVRYNDGRKSEEDNGGREQEALGKIPMRFETVSRLVLENHSASMLPRAKPEG